MAALVPLLAPLFGAIAIGSLVGVMRLFGREEARTFSRFVFLVAMPVAVFSFMRQSPPPRPEFIGMALAYLLALFITASAAFLAARRIGRVTVREAGAAVFTTTCGNAVFLGLPIALGIEGWGPPFLTLMVFEGTFVFGIGTALMTWPDDTTPNGAKKEAPALHVLGIFSAAALRALRNPIIIATLAGLVLSLLAIDLPAILAGPLDRFGQIASPFGLFVLGIYLAVLVGKPLPSGGGRSLLPLLLGLKLVVFPVLCGALTWLFTRDGTLVRVAALFACLPPAVSSVVLAASYRQYEEGTATLVSIGTILGLVTTTVALILFAG